MPFDQLGQEGRHRVLRRRMDQQLEGFVVAHALETGSSWKFLMTVIGPMESTWPAIVLWSVGRQAAQGLGYDFGGQGSLLTQVA